MQEKISKPLKRRTSTQLIMWILCSIGLACIWLPPQTTHAQWRQFKRKWPKLWIQKNPCIVYKVIDGDTTHVKCDGRKEKLRLVGIDTPETKHPFKPIEYFGPQASARAKALLPIGSKVWLGFGRRPRHGRLPRGKYKRVLAYLFMPNGKMFNAKMVYEGYAFAMRRYPHVYMQRFIKLENAAKRRRLGMWADPAKVRNMVAGDTAYRQHGKRCRRQVRGRFSWVIGDSATKYYVTRRNRRAYFRTNPYTRVLFCSVRDAEQHGYKPAPFGYRPRYKHRRHYRKRRYETPNSSQILIIGNPENKTFRVYKGGSFRVFSSVLAAKKAGYTQAKRRRRRRSRRRRHRKGRRGRRGRRTRRGHQKGVRQRPNCGGKTPIVSNRRSKRYRVPTMKSYRRATKSKNAVYFCTEQEAINAGHVRAKR